MTDRALLPSRFAEGGLLLRTLRLSSRVGEMFGVQRPVYNIAVAEKGPLWLRLIAEGGIGQAHGALTLMQSPGPESWHPNPAFLSVIIGWLVSIA